MLSPHDGKLAGGHLRKALIPAVVSSTCPTQMGSGLHGGACDVAHLMVSSVFALASVSKSSAATLFVDVVSACASMHRRIAIPGVADSEELWRLHLASCGFDQDSADVIVRLACSVLHWESHGCSQHGLALLRDAHLHNWFSVEGLARVS